MISVLISFSRITLLTFIIVFTFIDLIQLFESKIGEALSQILNTIQIMMVVLFLVNSSIILFFVKEDYRIIILLVLQLILFMIIGITLNRITLPMSKALINNVMFLLSISFVFLERLNMDRALKQFAFAVLATFLSSLMILILRRIKRIQNFMFTFAAIGVLLLLIVSFIGEVEYGAKLSLSFMGLSIQPSEFVKILYLFFISGCIVTYKDFRGFLFATIGAGIHVLVLVISKDLGTALIFLTAYLFLIFIAYKNYIVLSVELFGAAIGGILAYNLFPHIQSRFIAWSDPLSDVENKGYQICQSLFAIGTGGWFGTGLTNGMPTKIPVVTKDFIFAAVSEELGAIAAVCLIAILMCTCIMFFNIAYLCDNSFYMLVTSGVGIIFAIQTILNIGGVIKFIPSTGVTLPFVSYGGSSLLSMFICLYISECSSDLIYTGKGKNIYD